MCSRPGMARSWIGALVAFAVLALAGFLLARTIGRYDFDDVLAAVGQLGGPQLAAAALFSFASYLVLTGVDLLAVRYAGRKLPYRQVAFASFVALSIGHSLGFAAVSSGAVRFRFYRRWGLNMAEIARVILFCGLTVAMGYGVLGGLVLAGFAPWIGGLIGVRQSTIYLASAVALSVPMFYFLAVALGRTVRLWRLHLHPPSPGVALGQVVIGSLDLALVAAVLHQTLGGSAALPYTTVLAVYLAAALAGVLSHAPGGIGVVEAVTLAALPGAETIAGLLAFRAIYYLVPLALGGAALAIFELSVGRRAPAGRARTAARGP
jgi:glycosyltransferase 2 family protein